MRSTQLFLEFARSPATQAEAARANYNSNVLCSKSLSSAGRMRPGKDYFFLKCRSRVVSPGMMCTAGAKLIPRKRHTKLTAFVARVSIAQWCQPYLSVFVGAHLLSMMLKKGFGRSSLKTSAIASNVVIVAIREAPCTTDRSSKIQLQQQRVM